MSFLSLTFVHYIPFPIIVRFKPLQQHTTLEGFSCKTIFRKPYLYLDNSMSFLS